ncbi:MAG: aldo/keto reductase [Acidobacteriota bacterium]|nr:MAG: aldo/keto reductase [Acidobacteriota bacterium]
MGRVTRREFIKSSVAVAVGTAGGVVVPAKAARRSATDWVKLGNSGVEVTRLAFGTGTYAGRVQRELGQAEFTRLVRHAYDRGIRFFESADAYGEMHEMLAVALKGLPRDSYRLMTKIRWRSDEAPEAAIDRFRKELNSDYFDILLMHCLRTSGWGDELKELQDKLSEAKHKQVILAHGASCHGLLPLRDFPGANWLDVALLRVNHNGTLMDNLKDETKVKGDVQEVVGHIAKVHEQGTGVIGMKLIGEGAFKTPEERDASLRFVLNLGTVDAVTIGYKSTAEIDEAIERIDHHLNA